MSNLAELGLEGVLGDDTTKVAEPVQGTSSVEVTDTAEETEKKKREQINVGTGADDFMDLVPEIKRGGGFGGPRESKFGFETLVAPEETGNPERPYRYAVKKFSVQEGVDPAKHQSSVNSAVSAYNREQKEENTGVKLIVRSQNDAAGALAAVIVFRVDGTLDKPAA
jgi:hypothetical protein